MNIEQRNNNEVIITGNIKTLEDSLQIKDTIRNLVAQGSRSINLQITDSFSMTSTAIGALMKTVRLEKTHVSVNVGDNRLYTLLEELGLLQEFNVRLTGQ